MPYQIDVTKPRISFDEQAAERMAALLADNAGVTTQAQLTAAVATIAAGQPLNAAAVALIKIFASVIRIDPP